RRQPVPPLVGTGRRPGRAAAARPRGDALENIDDLMRVRQNFIEHNQPLDRDLLRHPTSGSMGFYAKAHPEPSTVEFCIEHQKITDPNHRPRAMARARWASNVWLPPVRAHS